MNINKEKIKEIENDIISIKKIIKLKKIRLPLFLASLGTLVVPLSVYALITAEGVEYSLNTIDVIFLSFPLLLGFFLYVITKINEKRLKRTEFKKYKKLEELLELKIDSLTDEEILTLEKTSKEEDLLFSVRKNIEKRMKTRLNLNKDSSIEDILIEIKKREKEVCLENE